MEGAGFIVHGLQDYNVQKTLHLLTRSTSSSSMTTGRGYYDSDLSAVSRVGLLLLVGLLLNYGMTPQTKYGDYARLISRFYLTLTLASLSVLIIALSVLYLADSFIDTATVETSTTTESP